MKCLSLLVVIGLVALSSAIAIPEPIYIEPDSQSAGPDHHGECYCTSMLALHSSSVNALANSTALLATCVPHGASCCTGGGCQHCCDSSGPQSPVPHVCSQGHCQSTLDIAHPEPMSLELDIEAIGDEDRHVRETSPNTLVKLQQVVKGLEDPDYHGASYSLFIKHPSKGSANLAVFLATCIPSGSYCCTWAGCQPCCPRPPFFPGYCDLDINSAQGHCRLG